MCFYCCESKFLLTYGVHRANFPSDILVSDEGTNVRQPEQRFLAHPHLLALFYTPSEKLKAFSLCRIKYQEERRLRKPIPRTGGKKGKAPRKRFTIDRSTQKPHVSMIWNTA